MSWFMGIGRAVKPCVWSFDACGNWQARMAVTRLQWDAARRLAQLVGRPAALPAKVAMAISPIPMPGSLPAPAVPLVR